jgi:(p)ppGpp synthase/HD superfamily hydrolase
MTEVTTRYVEAIELARSAHSGQYRKGTRIPYLYHLLAVSSLVLEFGGDEDQAIAGLLHDLIEDCGTAHLADLQQRFGPRVSRIVLDCTDGDAEQKRAAITLEERRADWRSRKLRYIAHLRDADPASLLVSACDKLHNARAIVADLEHPGVGSAVFERFTAGQAGTLAYYHSLALVMTERDAAPARQLELTVARMHGLAGTSLREALS